MSEVDGLGEVLTIAQVAKLAKWSYDRMLNHLAAVNAQTGGMLLKNVSRGKERPRWTLTLGALKATHPEWFHAHQRAAVSGDEVRVQLADHEERIETLERISDLHTAAIARRVA